jgi:hypothetical protein
MGCWTFLIDTQPERKYPPSKMGEQASERRGRKDTLDLYRVCEGVASTGAEEDEFLVVVADDE